MESQQKALQRYEDEQQQLQDGSSSIRIDPPKEPEVDPRIYRDVESLLFRGFIVAHAEINGVHFVLKSLNHHEYEQIQLIVGHRTDAKIQRRFYSFFLAYGVLMVDGQPVLHDRFRWVSELASVFEAMGNAPRNKIVRLLSEVNRRAYGAVVLAEAYAMESYSRFRWAQLKGLDLTSTAVTGFSGSELLGMNWAQMVWRALNSYEDAKEVAERDWDYAKFVGSCFAGKGISKVYSHDIDRKRKEKDDRITRKEVLIRHVLLGESLSRDDQIQGSQVIVTARTVEALADQLERSLRGEKDWHDEVVAAAEAQMRQKEQDRQDKLRQMAEERESKYGSNLLIGGTANFEGLTREQMMERLVHRKQYEAQRLASVMSVDEDPEKHEQHKAKWGLK